MKFTLCLIHKATDRPFRNLISIPRFAVPWMLMSATIRPRAESALYKEFKLAVPPFLTRGLAIHPEIQYEIMECEAQDAEAPFFGFCDPIAQTVVETLDKFPQSANGQIQGRVIVYCLPAKSQRNSPTISTCFVTPELAKQMSTSSSPQTKTRLDRLAEKPTTSGLPGKHSSLSVHAHLVPN